MPRILAIAAAIAAGSEIASLEEGSTFAELLAMYQKTDSFVQRWIYVGISKSKGAGVVKEWKFNAIGLLCYRNAVYVPDDSAIKTELLWVNHDDLLDGHFGVIKTLEIIKCHYFWPSMRRDVRDYVRSYPVYQRTKVQWHCLYGMLSSFPVPSRPWQEIILDFITGLLPFRFRSRVYDSILVIINRYTKMA